MGSARAMSPAAAGRQMKSVRRSEALSVSVNSPVLPDEASLDRLGKATVPTATPKTPSGNCTSRSA